MRHRTQPVPVSVPGPRRPERHLRGTRKTKKDPLQFQGGAENFSPICASYRCPCGRLTQIGCWPCVPRASTWPRSSKARSGPTYSGKLVNSGWRVSCRNTASAPTGPGLRRQPPVTVNREAGPNENTKPAQGLAAQEIRSVKGGRMGRSRFG
jgi:hypothetical protein